MAKRIISVKINGVAPIIDFSRIASGAERTLGGCGTYKGISLAAACGISPKTKDE